MTSKQLKKTLSYLYPNIKTWGIRDGDYGTVEYSEGERLYIGFQRWVKAILKPFFVYKWVKDKGDCDKWARVMLAYVILRNWIGRSLLPKAIGEIHYYQGGDKNRPHSILAFVDNSGFVYEIEPQPNNGVKELTNEERDTVWSVDF